MLQNGELYLLQRLRQLLSKMVNYTFATPLLDAVKNVELYLRYASAGSSQSTHSKETKAGAVFITFYIICVLKGDLGEFV
jgi:hypothetical protein